ncbi:MAG: hypothetical protein H5U34_05410, partial [Klebsiella pneumoniae]|nr:hypothetical protein [Klebsiella pneumoniae]
VLLVNLLGDGIRRAIIAGVVMSWVSLLFFAFAIFIMIFDPDTLLALLASPLWFIALWGFWKLKQRREGQLQLDNQSA